LSSSKRFHHPAHRRMLSVLHLYPVLRPTGMIRAITALAHEPFEPHLARGAKEIRPDLATLERIDEDALGPAREQTLEAGLAEMERQLPEVVIALGYPDCVCVARRPNVGAGARDGEASNRAVDVGKKAHRNIKGGFSPFGDRRGHPPRAISRRERAAGSL